MVGSHIVAAVFHLRIKEIYAQMVSIQAVLSSTYHKTYIAKSLPSLISQSSGELFWLSAYLGKMDNLGTGVC